MSDLLSSLKIGLIAGIKKGLSGFVWMGRIVVPISFAIMLVQWLGWLARISFVFTPLMRLLNLPSEAALPIISSMAINIYAAIAAISVIPFSISQMTLIAIFCLIAHNLILEGIIQARSGVNFVIATLVRVGTAVVAILIISRFFQGTAAGIPLQPQIASQAPFLEVLKDWGLDTLRLLVKIFIIIMSIMVAQEILRSLCWIDYLVKFFEPFMSVLGLSSRTALVWVTAVVFGLMYGGAAIIEEVNKGALSRNEIQRLHVSIGINHSMVEDPSLFVAFGVNPFWLWIPRLVIVIIAVQAFRLADYINHKIRRGDRAP